METVHKVSQPEIGRWRNLKQTPEKLQSVSNSGDLPVGE